MDIKDRLMTINEVAELFRVTRQTISNWCAKGIIPFETYPCGKRFSREAIENFRRSRAFGVVSEGAHQ